MTVRVRFFAQFRERYGGEQNVDPAPGASVADVVRFVAGTDGGEDAAVDPDGRIRDYVILMRNGSRLEHDEAEAIQVEDGDELAVFPPVAGG
jgi:molybdopterin synthase sulfur carrier subunit